MTIIGTYTPTPEHYDYIVPTDDFDELEDDTYNLYNIDPIDEFEEGEE